jgi:serine/threonine protein kinase
VLAHIVRILDSGRDEDNGVHFVVMEWVGQDLGSVLAPGRYTGWEAYYRAVGEDVLDALAFAHTRSTAHRDYPRCVPGFRGFLLTKADD